MTTIRRAVAGIADDLAPPSAVRAAIYCRRSQHGGRSVERQEQDGRRIAADKGWTVTATAVYKEWASASEFSERARKEWARLLKDIEAGEFDAVIFYMEDRSSRHLLAAIQFVQACNAAGVDKIVLPSYEYDLTDPDDRNRLRRGPGRPARSGEDEQAHAAGPAGGSGERPAADGREAIVRHAGLAPDAG